MFPLVWILGSVAAIESWRTLNKFLELASVKAPTSTPTDILLNRLDSLFRWLEAIINIFPSLVKLVLDAFIILPAASVMFVLLFHLLKRS